MRPVRSKIAEIEARWEQPQRVSRFGRGIEDLVRQAMEDIAFLLALIEDMESRDASDS